jgi:hypothetical protein
MKKSILILMLLVCVTVSKAVTPFNIEGLPDILTSGLTKEYKFIAGDTTTTFSINNASAVYICAKDSAMTGTDSLGAWIEYTMNGVTIDVPITVHRLSTTTTTTFIAGELLIAGDGVAAGWVWYPAGVSGADIRFTGTLRLSRLNYNDHVTPYTPRTQAFVIQT